MLLGIHKHLYIKLKCALSTVPYKNQAVGATWGSTDLDQFWYINMFCAQNQVSILDFIEKSMWLPW